MLISKLSKTVTHGNKRASGDFEFNKGVGMLCMFTKEEYLRIRKVITGKRIGKKSSPFF